MQKDLPLHLIAAHEAKLTPPIGDLALNHLQKHEMAASNLKSRRSRSGNRKQIYLHPRLNIQRIDVWSFFFRWAWGHHAGFRSEFALLLKQTLISVWLILFISGKYIGTVSKKAPNVGITRTLDNRQVEEDLVSPGRR